MHSQKAEGSEKGWRIKASRSSRSALADWTEILYNVVTHTVLVTPLQRTPYHVHTTESKIA